MKYEEGSSQLEIGNGPKRKTDQGLGTGDLCNASWRLTVRRSSCPVGTADSSPALQCWEISGLSHRSPVGTTEGVSIVPTGLKNQRATRVPALKCWASIAPSLRDGRGTSRRLGFSRAILLAPLALLACALMLCAQDAATHGAGILPATAADVSPTESTSRPTPTSSRVRIDIDETGLPRQIYIAADERELPLELRVPGAQVPDAALAAIGRGNRLRAPITIVAIVDGKVIPATVVSRAVGSEPAKLKAGPFDVTAQTVLCGGAAVLEIHYEKKDAVTAELELLAQPVSPVDLAFDGQVADIKTMKLWTEVAATSPTSSPASAPATRPVPPAAFRDMAIAAGEGVVWQSPTKGFTKKLFIGTADGGIRWSSFNNGWPLDPDRSIVELRRSKIGEVTFAARLVGSTDAAAEGVLACIFRPSPFNCGRDGARKAQWIGVAPAAGDSDAFDLRTLKGTRCGDIGPGKYDHIDLYPSSLMRAIIGDRRGAILRIVSNVRTAQPGDDPAYDRAILGRALLHDVGVDPNGLSQPAEYVRLVKGLKGFGFFEANDIEFIPYWRSGAIVRYGEEFNPNSPFKLTEDNPAAGTYVSVYRRPFEKDGKKGYQAMFVIFNEQPKPIRERLYIFTPPRIWGGPGNVQTGAEIIAGYDFGKIPAENSDWRQKKIVDHHYVFGPAALVDLEDRSVANISDSKGQTAEIYGPLHIQAHDYRVFWGYWIPGVEKKK